MIIKKNMKNKTKNNNSQLTNLNLESNALGLRSKIDFIAFCLISMCAFELQHETQ
jgi:hypothetical protein